MSGLSLRDVDPLLDGICDLCDRYAGRSVRDERDVVLWISRVVLGRPWSRIAAADGRGERTLRRRVRRVTIRMRMLHGPRVGHPVEELLYPSRGAA